MKKILIAAAFMLICTNIFAQLNWVKYSGNPIVDSTKDMSATSSYAPQVLIDGSVYHLWYTRKTGTNRENIGYMTSANGLSWTLVDSLAIMPSTDASRFDFKKIGHASVIKEGDTLKMWYWGGNTSSIAGIGFAWSLSGQNWTRVDGPGIGKSVIDQTIDGSGALAIATPCVIKDGSTYKMWYARAYLVGSKVIYRIGYATSSNGLNWTVVSGSGTNGSVIDIGASGKFDESMVFFPSVIKNGSQYQMWYAGYDSLATIREGYATSGDGISWTKVIGNSAKGSCLDSGGTSSVSLVGSVYKMWYSSTSPAGFAYATSGNITGLSKLKPSNVFNVYPNPSRGNFKLEFDNGKTTGLIQIYNLRGQEVFNKTIIDNPNIESNLQKGLYFIVFTHENGMVLNGKIIIE